MGRPPPSRSRTHVGSSVNFNFPQFINAAKKRYLRKWCSVVRLDAAGTAEQGGVGRAGVGLRVAAGGVRPNAGRGFIAFLRSLAWQLPGVGGQRGFSDQPAPPP